MPITDWLVAYKMSTIQNMLTPTWVCSREIAFKREPKWRLISKVYQHTLNLYLNLNQRKDWRQTYRFGLVVRNRASMNVAETAICTRERVNVMKN